MAVGAEGNMFRDRNQTITKAMSFLCAPDTIDPPRPRGKGGAHDG
jgi:hypothetical protein